MGIIYVLMLIQGFSEIYVSMNALKYYKPFRIGNTTTCFSTYFFLIELAIGIIFIFGVYGLYKNKKSIYYLVRTCYYILFYYYIFMVLYVLKSNGSFELKVPTIVVGAIASIYCIFVAYFIKKKKSKIIEQI